MKEFEINRRDLMKTAVAGVAAGALGVLGGRKGRAAKSAGPFSVRLPGGYRA